MLICVHGRKTELAMKRVAAGGRAFSKVERLQVERCLARVDAEAERLRMILKTERPRRAK